VCQVVAATVRWRWERRRRKGDGDASKVNETKD
jgi:hypothetical protein